MPGWQEEQKRVEQGLPPPLHPSAHPGLKKRAPPNSASGNGRKGGRSRGKGSMPRRRSRSIEPGEELDAEEQDVDDGLEYEEDENRLLCVCQQPYSADSAMVSCDSCGEWFHLRCVGLTQVCQSTMLNCNHCE